MVFLNDDKYNKLLKINANKINRRMTIIYGNELKCLKMFYYSLLWLIFKIFPNKDFLFKKSGTN